MSRSACLDNTIPVEQANLATDRDSQHFRWRGHGQHVHLAAGRFEQFGY